MKNMNQKTCSILIAILFAVSLNGFSQNKKVKDADGKMHIKIEIEKNGKTTKVDTVINSKDLPKLNQHLKELDVNLGSLDELPEPGDVHVFKFEFDDKKFEKHMKVAEQRMKEAGEKMKGKETDMKELNERMKEMEKNMQEQFRNFKFEFKCDSSMKINMEQLHKDFENSPGNMNFNFKKDGKTINIEKEIEDDKNGNDAGGKKIIIKKTGNGDHKTIIIDNEDNDNAPGEKKIIIRKSGNEEGFDNHNMKEERRVYVILKSSVLPEKQKAEFASEPVNDEKEMQWAQENNSNRFGAANENTHNSWLNNFACYPNPSSGEFTLRFHLTNSEPADVKIIDLAGREVYSEKLYDNAQLVEKQIKLPSNPSSAYLLILRQGNNWLHEKIFVKS